MANSRANEAFPRSWIPEDANTTFIRLSFMHYKFERIDKAYELHHKFHKEKDYWSAWLRLTDALMKKGKYKDALLHLNYMIKVYNEGEFGIRSPLTETETLMLFMQLTKVNLALSDIYQACAYVCMAVAIENSADTQALLQECKERNNTTNSRLFCFENNFFLNLGKAKQVAVAETRKFEARAFYKLKNQLVSSDDESDDKCIQTENIESDTVSARAHLLKKYSL